MASMSIFLTYAKGHLKVVIRISVALLICVSVFFYIPLKFPDSFSFRKFITVLLFFDEEFLVICF